MNSTFGDDFSTCTAKNVRIGIIDSGYSPGKHKIRIGDGINLSTNGSVNSEVKLNKDYTDNIGHGTACAGIIHKKAPESEIFPVKIFNTELVSDIDKLTKAIEWCIKNKLHIINLSLGTTETENKNKLQEICDIALSKSIFIIAAISNDKQESYPAALSNVYGVNAGKVRGKYDYYFDQKSPIQFIARGDRQRLDWIDGKQIFLGGTSFAAPHITAIVALIIQKYPDISFVELNRLLKKYSLTETPLLVDGNEFYNIPGVTKAQTKPGEKLANIHQQNNIKWIKKAVIFPYNKEMHSLVRYKDLLPFQILHIVDVVGKRTIGKDSGEIIGDNKSGIIVEKKIDNCLKEVDTIILGYLDEISRIKKRDVLKEILELAIEHKKNVYSLTPVTKENYPEQFSKFKDKKLHISSPVISYSDFENITKTFDWRIPSKKPVIGVFGTSPQQGKFTSQLALRQELQKLGYKVGQLGTEHQSALFGFDFTFPNGYDGQHNIRIPMDLHITLLHSVLAGIENMDNHITIVGGQSGIIPYSFAEKSQGYTLSSLILILGTQPDAYILVVNSVDEMEFIQENINVLKGLGRGETILLVFSDKKKEILNTFGRSSIVNQQLNRDEIQELTKKLEDRFGIPATEVISDGGRKRMAVTVENYFSDDSNS
jgi:uncharacterized NAD-dependent epimerase/dehydratase family protein